jgi:FkbM family methyltransferase
MPNLAGLFKIEYVCQPKYLLRRISSQLTGSVRDRESTNFPLPWGLTISANPDEEHGEILRTLGVIDLSVTESIWRLLEPNSTFLDIGANIGYMTSVAIGRLESFPQSHGKVIAYEPHPDIYTNFLECNVNRWRSQIKHTQVILHQIALSDRNGMTELAIPVDFERNQGLAQVIPISEDPSHFLLQYSNNQNFDRIPIQCQKLDDCLADDETIDLMKIDVEGHELAVFKGASNHLNQQQIHHIIFEAHDAYPSALTDLLESYGYTIFGIDRHLLGPRLVAPGSDADSVAWLPRNYLATCKSAAVVRAFSDGGWQIFK